MPDITTLILFAGASLILLITPGPSIIYIMTQSIEQGRSAGIIAVLGIELGSFIHVIAATFGISALLMASATAFNIIKFIGAGYLIYLGICKLIKQEMLEGNDNEIKNNKLSVVFYKAILVNLLNPKTALFFLAFLPQFIDVSKGSTSAQIMFLGLVFIMLAILTDTSFALLAGSIGKWLKRKTSYLKAQRYITGSIYIALGVATAFTGSDNK
ncbi:MAG: RhtB family transporter [Peptococcaceae bacterium BICA1-8]|nr:MAG: RhtB family transporter [Peptococcaceae bacterium BICA1-8]